MKKKLKVIHIAQANGGVERYLKMFFKYSKNSCYENQLIASELYEPIKDEFENLGVKVHIVNMQREISLINDLRSMIDLGKIIKYEKPDIVYTHSSKAGGLGRIPAKILGCRNFYNPHGWSFDMNISKKRKSLYKLVEKNLAMVTDRVIAISPYEKCIAINNKVVKESKIKVIENGVDLEAVQNKSKKEVVLKENKWGTENVIIGMVARVSEQKSPDTFIDIAERLIKIRPECRFIIVGDGEQRNIIEDRIRSNKLEDKIRITGWVNNVEDYISSFDIALLTSKWEGFGLVITEYMAHKKPVVASNVGGISNIITHDYNGYLVDNNDVDKYIEYIIKILDNSHIRDRIIDNAIDLVNKRYNFKRVIEEHDKILNI